MADLKQAYGSSTGISISLASLAGSSARESTALDNNSDLFLDIMVQVGVTLQTGTPTGDKAIYIWAYGSEDGSNFTDNASGTDAAITLRVPTNLRPLGVINCPDAGGLFYVSSPMSLAAAFGGIIPRAWGIVVQNATGVALSATEGDHQKTYTGIYYQTV